jgi:hypothetical protein
MGQHVPEISLIRAKMAPICPRRDQHGPRWKMGQDGPKMGQDGPKMGQDGPWMGHDGPKMPKSGPTWAKMSPRWAQDGPRRPQDGRKMAPQDGPKMAPKSPSEKGRGREVERSWKSIKNHDLHSVCKKQNNCLSIGTGSASDLTSLKACVSG